MLSHLLRILNLKRSNPLDYSDDEIANAGDVYTGLIAAGCDRDTSSPSAGGSTRAGVSRAGRGGFRASSHSIGDN